MTELPQHPEPAREPASHPAPPAASAGAAGASADASATPSTDVAESADAPASASGVTEDKVKLALRRVKDPELNLNILDLGLIYAINVTGADISIDMSLTSPGCPSGPEIMTDAEQQLKAMPGVGNVSMNLVWSPPWTPDRIEPRVRAYLGF